MYLGVVIDDAIIDAATTRQLLHSAVRTALASAPFALPAPDDATRAETWFGRSGRTALIAWTNHPNDAGTPPITEDGPAVHGWSGYVGDAEAERRLRTAPDLLGASASAGGCFAFLRATDDTVEAVTTVTRPEPMYHAEGTGFRVVGTRALLVHLVARGHGDDPRAVFHAAGLRAFANNGYFFAGHTPFAGVSAVPPSGRVRVSGSGTRVDTLPRESVATTVRAHQAAVRDIADAIVAAVEPLRAYDTPITLSLTGGRDSRLIAAALHAAGIPFRAATNGRPGHPDVDIAAQICALLGIDHRINLPKVSADERTMWVEDPAARTRRVLEFTDGMTAAWDDVTDYGPYNGSPVLSGLGGEILRGGYVLSAYTELTTENAKKLVTNTFLGSAATFTAAANDAMREQAAPWLARVLDDPHGTLDDLYLTNRVGRWGAARGSASTIRRPYFAPLLDNVLVQNVRRVPAATRWSERLVWDLLVLLAPALAELPIQGRSWRFGVAGDVPPPDGYTPPAVLTAPPGAGYNWRRLDDEGLHATVRKLVFDSLDDPLLTSVVDRGAAERAVEARPPRYAQHVWYLLAAGQLLRGQWWDPSTREPRRLAVELTLPQAG